MSRRTVGAVAATAVAVTALSALAVLRVDYGWSPLPDPASSPQSAPGATAGNTTDAGAPTGSTPAAGDASGDGATPDPSAPRTERLLAAGGGQLWRATTGRCGESAPSLELSTDAGATWATIDIGGAPEIDGLTSDAAGAAVLVVATDDCGAATTLRTDSYGDAWTTVDDDLARAVYVSPADRASVAVYRTTVAAPCDLAHGVSVSQGDIGVICDGRAYVLDAADQWVAAPFSGVSAIAVDRGRLLAAHRAEGCAGIGLSAVDTTDVTAQGTAAVCVDGTDAGAPAAIAATDGGVLVWSGDVFTTVAFG